MTTIAEHKDWDDEEFDPREIGNMTTVSFRSVPEGFHACSKGDFSGEDIVLPICVWCGEAFAPANGDFNPERNIGECDVCVPLPPRVFQPVTYVTNATNALMSDPVVRETYFSKQALTIRKDTEREKAQQKNRDRGTQLTTQRATVKVRRARRKNKARGNWPTKQPEAFREQVRRDFRARSDQSMH